MREEFPKGCSILSLSMSLLLLVAGCSDGGSNTNVLYDVPPDTASADLDASVPETLDFSALEQVSVEYVPQEGEFLWPCAENTECDSGFCVMTASGTRCTKTCVEDCPAGWTCVEAEVKPDLIYICIPRFMRLCDPCKSNEDCQQDNVETSFLDQCLEFPDGAGRFCGADCSTDPLGCPKGFDCKSVTTPGGTFQQCYPAEGVCKCSFPAIQASKATACFVKNEFGNCEGERVCTVDGLSDCSSGIPEAELCDDKDNDCDLTTDEGCDDDGDGYCDVKLTTSGTPAVCGSGGGDCDDGDSTTFPGGTELCDKKDNNCDGTIDDGLCEDGNPCTDDLCDPEEGCSHPNNAKLCDDGNSCTDSDHCFEGSCQGGAKICEDNNPCTENLCDPVSDKGCYFANNSSPCADDGNPCTIDVCEGGACQHKLATGIPCDDGNPCTEPDLCQSGQCVPGGPKKCDDEEDCTKDTCDKAQGCQHQVLVGTACSYNVLGICDIPGTCGSNGCVPQPNCNCPNCTICVCCGIVQFCLDGLLPGT
jgi:hypothetical protein